jgi:hypothetical protein
LAILTSLSMGHSGKASAADAIRLMDPTARMLLSKPNSLAF